MDMFLRLRFLNFFRKYAISALACCWILGLILGILISHKVYVDSGYLVSSFQSRNAITLIMVILLPVLTSVLVTYMGHLWVLPLIAFCKSFSFSYVSCIFLGHFGSAGWLIQFLIMFSNCMLLPLLWWFWCALLRNRQQSQILLSVLMILLTIILAVLDDFLIFPVLSALQIS